MSFSAVLSEDPWLFYPCHTAVQTLVFILPEPRNSLPLYVASSHPGELHLSQLLPPISPTIPTPSRSLGNRSLPYSPRSPFRDSKIVCSPVPQVFPSLSPPLLILPHRVCCDSQTASLLPASGLPLALSLRLGSKVNLSTEQPADFRGRARSPVQRLSSSFRSMQSPHSAASRNTCSWISHIRVSQPPVSRWKLVHFPTTSQGAKHRQISPFTSPNIIQVL